MKTEQKLSPREIIYNEVVKFWEKDKKNSLPSDISINDISHIFEIGTSILGCKWKIDGFYAGGFVSSFLSNDLEGTFAKADNINVKAIYFYLRLCANVEAPKHILL